MDQLERELVLRRKIGGSWADKGDDDKSALRALRLATARASRKVMNLRLDVIGGSHAERSDDTLAEAIEEDGLLLQLQRDGAVSGAAILSPSLVNALVQQQTYGALFPSEDGERTYTDTDAALCAPICEEILNRATALTDREPDRHALNGHAFSARVKELPSLLVALEGDRFRVFDLTVEIEAGMAQGRLTFVAPVWEPPMVTTDQAPSGQGLTLGDAAMHALVRLNAIMCRIPLMSKDLMALSEGDFLPLPAYRLDRTELLTMSGKPIAAGRLGRVDGLRAVRVNETTAPGADFASAPDVVSRGLSTPQTAVDIGDDGDFDLDQMDQQEAIKEISQLAGLERDALDNAS